MLSVLTFRTPDEAVAKADNTPYGLSAGIWSEKGSRILSVANRLRAGVVGEHLQPVRPDRALRRLQGVRFRSRGRPARAGGLPRCLSATPDASTSVRPTSSTSAERSPLGVRPVLPGARPQGRTAGPRRAGLAQGRPRRGRRGPLGVREVVDGHGLQPRAGALPRGRDARGPAGAVRRRGAVLGTDDGPASGGPGRRRRRPARALRRLDGQVRPGRRLDEPGGRAVLHVHAARTHRGRGRARPAGLVAARARLRRRAGAGPRATRPWS